MIVRCAETADAPAIAEIWNREVREAVSTFTTVEKTVADLKADIMERGDAFLVAEVAGSVIGFATYYQFRGGPGYTHSMEYSIHLDHVARGKGAGRELVAQLEANARAAGVHAFVAGISGENAAGVAFHEKIGFQHVGRMPEVGRKFGRWMDLILMQKLL